MNFRALPLFFSFIFLTACGQTSRTATVTLLTGLEHTAPTKNLMARLVNQNFASTSPACKQAQIVAGFGPADGNGTANITFSPVSLVTTIASTFEAGTDAATWLLDNSDLAPISLPAPTGVQLDFGIIGALIAPSNPGLANGSVCPQLYGGSANLSYALIGHSSATISGNTTLAIRTWILNTNSAPQTPSAGDPCLNNGGNALDQTCPDHNYYLAKADSASCGGGAQTIHFQYAIGTNGNTPVDQAVNCLATPNQIYPGVRIPNITPMTIYAADTSGNIISGYPAVTITKNNFQNGMATGISVMPGSLINLMDRGGVEAPGSVSMNYFKTPNAGNTDVTLSWGGTSYATDYSINRYNGNVCTGSPITVLVNQNVQTTTDSSVTAGTYCYSITAHNSITGTTSPAATLVVTTP